MPKVRIGKTAKERASGVHGNRFANMAARVAWQRDNGDFPTTACNGKRNRHRITGKEGKAVFLK